MPIYEYMCPRGHYFDLYLPVELHTKEAQCPKCTSIASQLVSRISVHVPNTELRKIEAKAHSDGFIIKEPGLDKDAKRNKEYQKQKTRRRIRKVVEDTVSEFDF